MESLCHADAVSSSEEMLAGVTSLLLRPPLSPAAQAKPSLANVFR